MKTKTTHTPGPWYASDERQPGGHYGRRDEPDYVGIGTGAVHVARAVMTGCVPPEQARANARLIASAPELLSALLETQALLRAKFHVSSMPAHKAVPFNRVFAANEAAIARAEGK